MLRSLKNQIQNLEKSGKKALDFRRRFNALVGGQGEEFELTMTLRGHHSGVRSVSFSPDGTKVASGSYDKTIKIWEDPRHRELKVTMLCLRRANRRRRDFGLELPSEAGRKLYNPDILRKLWKFL